MANEEELRDYLKWVTANLHDTRQRLREVEEQAREPIAIVGMSCRYPGGIRAPEDMWELVATGTDAVSDFPGDRGWDVMARFFSASSTAQGAFVYDAAEFDAGFFGMSPREAAATDPQQRLLLEASWEALERAGVDPGSLRGSQTGVFAGASGSGYGTALSLLAPKGVDGFGLTALAASVVSGRVSYTLGLEGPAVTVDTACSSSLVAVHLACQALRAGDCTLALAAGVAVMCDPGSFSEFSQQGGMAADGRCKSFAGAADGIGWGEGAGVVVLERLSDARRHGRRVLAVVAGSAINQDGASNGLTAPNGPSQQRVIRAALANAGLSAGDVDVVEAHGTGTVLGDPIEAQALLATYGRARPPERPLWLGSVKSNIGHTAAASGVAGVIKMVLALQHATLPATLHVDVPTPHVDWSAGHVRLLTEAMPWAASGRPRRAGVSGFGVSGTNVHVIVEEAPPEDGDSGADGATDDGTGVTLEGAVTAAQPLLGRAVTAWPVSGRTAAGLQAQAGRLAGWVAARPGLEPADVAWSLAVTRSAFEHRAVITGASPEELTAGLTAAAAGEPRVGTVNGSVPPGTGPGLTVFVFPGQGGQWAGMGRELAVCCPVFAGRLAECGAALAPFVDWSLEEVLAGAAGAPGLERVEVVQPVLWAVMVSLAAVWQAAGVTPDAVVGHSQGEIAAACVAGVLSLEDSAKVVALRSRALRALAGRGGMLSVAEPAEAVRRRIADSGGRLSVAAVNGPSATVVAGEPGALEELAAGCAAAGVRARVLPVGYASHSVQVEGLRDEILGSLAGVTPRAGEVPMVSAMSGEFVRGPELDAGYWYASLRSPVEFERAVRVLAGAGHGVFVEVSPHPVLTGPVAETLEDAGGAGGDGAQAVVTGTLRRDDGGAARVLASMAQVHVRGAGVDWAAVLGGGRRVELPTYAFQRQRYWPRPERAGQPPAAGQDGAGLPGEARFWAAVEGGDAAGLAQTLAVGEEGLAGLLPALSSWRRRERDQSVTAGWRYRVDWVPAVLPERAAAVLAGRWLMVVPAGEAGGELSRWCAGALAGCGAGVVAAELPAGAGRAVVAGLVARVAGEAPLAGVVSLVGTDEAPLAGQAGVSAGLAGTLALVQGLEDAGLGTPLWLVTRGGVRAAGDLVPPRPGQAQVWGLGMVAGLEHPGWWGGLVDVAGALDRQSGGRLCVVLSGCGEDQVAIRPAGVLGRRLVRAAPPGGGTWRARGTVLATGATGSVGPHLVRWLGRSGAERVVLTSRGEPGRGTAALAAGLAAGGTEVCLARCDVADRGQVAGLVGRIGAGGPPLRAVVHAAVAVNLLPFGAVDDAELALTVSAKVLGARWLDELTAGLDLDAFVMFSSIAATWGSAEHAAYAAANAHLDALAWQRRARGLPATTVAWGVWDAGQWVGQDGAAGPRSVVPARLRRQGIRFLDPDLAFGALGAALADDETFLAVADVDWARFAPVFTATRPWRVLEDIPEVRAAAAPAAAGGGAVPGGELARRLAGAPGPERERLAAETVRGHAAAVLGYPSPAEVEPGRAFRDMGFDSLTAVELRDRLNTAAGLRLPATVVFDYPSPLALAREITRQLLGAPDNTPTVSSAVAAAGEQEPIVVVGMACRFPGGVATPEQLWELVGRGRDGVGGFPADRGWDAAGLFDPDPDRAGTSYAVEGGFLSGIADFDAGFFGISPREALAMDPQQRLLLEISWEALERAGIDPVTLRGSQTGVFAGAASSGYASGLPDGAGGAEGYRVTGAATSVISGRVSYVMGLEGPAVTVDTACSSSLVAVHLACQALRAGDCTLALAGGVAVMVSPDEFVAFSRQRALAADGRCKAFGAGADGMGLAEGAGVVLLERLSDAVRHGRRVLAVVAGSAVNQDGASNGLTAPNGPSQQRVIRAALASAGLSAGDVDVVEGHGTGTTLGDPIEAQALLAAYGQDRDPDRPLWLGSVKSNIGHAQAAAGVAGVIKMVLALRHQVLPATLHADEPSPHVDWSAGHVRLLTGAVPWPAGGRPRRAGVSAFGISGTNAHAILQEAPPLSSMPPSSFPGSAFPSPAAPLVAGGPAWVVSGGSAGALRAQAERLAQWVAARPGLELADVAWSLAVTRSALEHRAVVTGEDREGLLAGLAAVAAGEPGAGVVTGSVPPGGEAGRVVFVFPGQGGQWAGMGRELIACCPVFAGRLAECGRALAPHTDWSLEEVLAGAAGAPGLERVEVVQPVLWAVMVSLAAVWQAAGVTPDAVVGHSQGEIAAACVAGVLSLEDSAKVVALRSRALRALAGRGGMLSVAEPAEAVRRRIADSGGRLSVAAVNGPSATVVAGEPGALEELAAGCAAAGVRARVLPVGYASHSVQVEGLRDEILGSLAGIAPRAGEVPMVSAMSGEFVRGPELDAGYWYASLRSPVEFERAVRVLAGAGHGVFVEVSPHPVLTGPVAETLEDAGGAGGDGAQAVVTGTLRRDDGGAARVLASMAQVHVRGAGVDWAAVLGGGRRVELPTYAFQRQRYWPRPERAGQPPAAGQDGAGLPGEARFWAAVEGGDAAGLAQTLAVGEEGLAGLLPALSSWRRRERDQSVTAGWRYRESWVPVPAPGSAGVLAGRWLVVAGPAGAGVAGDVAGVLAAGGAEPVTAEAGTADRAALAELIGRALAGIVDPPAGVVSLLALEEGGAPGFPLVPGGLAGTLALVRALGDAGVRAPLWVLTRGAVGAVPGDVVAGGAQGSVWGLGRVAALEVPQRWGGLVDLPEVLDELSGARLCAVLAGCGEDQVAVRAGGVLGRRLVRAPRPGPGAGWVPRGTVLVTGGTGWAGGHVARWAAGRGASRLVLSSRSGPEAAGTARLAAELARAGARADVAACDVADRGAVAGLVAYAGTGLSAVVHAAGAVRGAVLEELDTAGLAQVLGAKAGGAAHLDELTAGLDLDVFVAFSSGSASWGSAELGAYAAANAFLDGLAQARRSRGLAGTSVAWGLWGGGGMGQGAAGRQLERLGVQVMDPRLAAEALGTAVGGEALVTVADVDWARFAPVFTVRRPSPLITALPEAQQALTAGPDQRSAAEAAGLAGRLAGLAAAEQDRVLAGLVRAEAAAVLGHDSAEAVEAGRAFKDLGFDSVTAVELRNRLGAATGLKLPATVVFDYPSPLALAREITRQLLGAPDNTPTVSSAVAAAGEPVAIVGMGCRFPGGARDPEGLWQLVAAGTDAVSPFPQDRGWDIHEGGAEAPHACQGGFLDDAAGFDPGFFGISPREALAMDPQQRLLLETSWEALEQAGIDPSALRGSATGVFTGAAHSAYGTGLGQEAAESEQYLLTGTAASVLSGRVSYVLGLEGPAVTVDTACSSALVALHLACQALRAGDCTLALAGGVHVMTTPGVFADFSRLGALASDGRCKAFAGAADGIGWGEGAGMLVVERLSDAVRHGRRVLAVVAGSAVNQDGASNGLTAPNGPSQQRVIRAALASAGLSAGDVDVVEGHGTGTTLGDPIEAQALLAAYGRARPAERPLWLGSVKSNIGHTAAAAGVAGVIKMVLALQHQVLPATLHVDVPTPEVDWSAGHVRLLTGAVPWPAGGRPRRAGVSAFGVSGTNAHAILQEAPASAQIQEEAPAPAGRGQRQAPVLAVGPTAWLISARTPRALPAQAERLAQWVAARPGLELADVAWSLAVTRSALEHRAVVTGEDREGLLAGLAAVAAGEPGAGVVTGSVPPGGEAGRVVFVFPGQGGQWAGMGRELIACCPVFAGRLAECGRALAPHTDWSLEEVLAGAAGAPGLERVEVVQPVLWAVMVSLAAVWQAAGVTPDAVVGHSQGEIAAACVAGVLSLEDSAKVVALRSRALRALAGRGGMLSVAEPAEAVRRRIADSGGRLSVAAVNGPSATVVAGEPGALEELAAGCAAAGVRARVLPVGYASHSVQVEGLRDEILGSLAGVTPRAGEVPMVSAMSGEFVRGPELDAGYWYASLRSPVEFERAVRVLAGAGHGVFVEVSPHPVLTGPVAETLEDAGGAGGDGAQAVVTGTLRRDDGGAARVLASMAQVHVRGAGVDWAAVLGGGRRVELPTYAFQRQRYWPRPERAGQPPAAGQDGAGLPGEARFWAAVEGGDAAGLAQTLAVGEEGLAGLLPALSSWRRRERDQSVTAGWRYRVDWVPAVLPERAAAVLAGRWLMVVPAGEAGGELSRWCAGALAGCGAGVVAAELPAGAGRAVVAGLVARVAGEAPLAGVVSLVGTDEAPLAGQAGVSAGLAGTLALVQGLEDAGLGTPLWLVTRGGVRAAGDLVPPRPGQAQVWGLGMVAGLEHPGWWGGLVDVAGALDRQSGGRLCVVLSGCGEDQVAIRPAGVLGRRLVRAAPPGGGTWRARGTVLATGATGSVGPHLVRWLGRSGAERVVLTSRGEPGRGTAALAAGLAAGGTEVCLARCDVADRGQVAGLVGRIGAGGPPLRAVVHAAVAVNLLPFGAVDDAELALTVSAKVLGARWLDELTAGLDLDAFVMFSSIAATWGSAEHAAYAAANAHLDALAWQRRARGLPATTVAWGVWDAGQWVGQDGAAGPRSVVPARLRRQGIRFLDPDLAFGALGAALADDETFLAVADVDWARFAPVFTATRPWRVLEDIPEVRAAAAPAAAGGGAVPGGELARRLAGAPGPERERLAAETVRGHAAAVLGYPSPAEVEPGRAFRDMGFDSLTAVELRDRLNTAAGLRLPATVVFDYPSPLALAREITRQLLGAPHDAPDDANTPAPIFVELQQLEATLGGISPDIHMRDQVTRRLQAILSEWIGAQGSAELTGADIELESATPDEVFSFFDRELGLS